MADNLKEKAVKGVFWSAIQKFSISIISFLSNIVLARLLTPDDYGCIGMLAIFIVISNALILGGFVSALIQRKQVTDIDYSTVFYWNLVISVLLYIVLFIAAPYIATFYRIELLSNVLRVLGLTLIINGLSAVQTTIIRRNMQFNKLAKINISSTTLSVVAAISFALLGYGVWSLVIQQIALGIFNFIFLWSSTIWKPKIEFSYQSLKEMFSYGSFLMLSELVNSLCDNIQGLIIGRKFSPSIMGYYAQAKKMEEVPTRSITQLVTQVIFPIYSRLQDDKTKLNHAAKEVLGIMNYVNYPLMALLLVLAEPLFAIIYGEKWLASVPYFQILCVAGLVNCMQSVNYQIVAATGRSKKLFYWNFVKRGCGLAFMLFGLIWGVKGLLWGMVAGVYLTYFINAMLAFPATNYSLSQQIIDTMPLLLITSTSTLVELFFSGFYKSYISWLFLGSLVFLLTYIGLSLLFKRREFNELCKIGKSYLLKK